MSNTRLQHSETRARPHQPDGADPRTCRVCGDRFAAWVGAPMTDGRCPLTGEGEPCGAARARGRKPARANGGEGMIDQPKRRGRPPKKWADDPWSAIRSPTPTARLRHKPGVGLQQAWQHATGLEWRAVPTVAADAADWEDA